MRSLPLAALALLCLFLAADNVRLRSRSLPVTAAPAPRAAAPRPETTADAIPAGAPAVRRAAPSPPAADEAPSFPVEEVKGPARSALVRSSRLKAVTPTSPLNLTEAQKKLIDELRKNRDAQTAVFKEQIARIEEQTELAIRQLLDPEQAKAYAASPGAGEALYSYFSVTDTAVAAPPSAYLGVGGSDAQGGGAAIGEVFPNTPALGAGLRTGDVVLEFNGQAIADWAGLAIRIREFEPGTSVVLTVRRGEMVFQQGVQLGAR